MVSLPDSAKPARTGYDLAHAFGWSDRDLSGREISRGDTSLSVARGTLGGEPAALFATVTARNGSDPIDSAALYAYHTGVGWGVVADADGLTVFNSHWLRDTNWFRLPLIAWNQSYSNIEILASLNPAGLISGEAERIANRQQEPSGFLKPVDDELVARLDKWRDQALRFARDSENVDALLQTLYAQLFVLRTVEDRNLDSRVPPVSSIIVDSQKIRREVWNKLLIAAREHVGSDLFDEDVALRIPEHVIAGVVDDLYHPRGLPGRDARYNFSWIEADVLGVAYEKYLATVLQPLPLPAQTELFLTPQRDVARISVRKSSGTYYTPHYIHNFLATRCVDEYFISHHDKAPPPHVIDFACGSGSFLVSAVNQILKYLKSRDPHRRWANELVEGGFLAGIDIDAKAVTTARLNLWQRLVEEPDALPLPNLANVIIHADGLDRDGWGKLDRKYEIVLGNPPFLTTSHVINRQSVESKFVSAKGRYDFSYLFVEQGLNVLTDDGHLGMVVPNRLYRNTNGQSIRDLIVKQADLLTLVDFGSTRPFDASSYIGCIVARRRPPEAALPDYVRVVEVRSLDPDFFSALLLEAAANAGESNSGVIRSYLARHPSSGAPWLLLSNEEQRALIMMEDVSIRLDTVAALPQGIRTGANDLFIFDVESTDGTHLCQVTNGLGETCILEIELLEWVVYGSEVQRYDRVIPTRRLLYPYRRNAVLPESELQERYPYTWQYFTRNREFLSARGSLKKSGGRWYELIWPRDESWLRKPKLLIRDLAPETAFAADQTGTTFLVGGTAVIPEDTNLLLALMAYLNSKVIDNLVRRTTSQFRGDFQKFEPRNLSGVPILNRLIDDPNFTDRLESLGIRVMDASMRGSIKDALNFEEEIEEMIRSAVAEYGIGLEA
jgi:methylase of polypeptide subunit release factors